MSTPRSVVDSFRMTLDLFETGVALMRQNLKRADPTVSESDIDERLHAWLVDRPGARHGDSAGTPVTGTYHA